MREVFCDLSYDSEINSLRKVPREGTFELECPW